MEIRRWQRHCKAARWAAKSYCQRLQQDKEGILDRKLTSTCVQTAYSIHSGSDEDGEWRFESPQSSAAPSGSSDWPSPSGSVISDRSVSWCDATWFCAPTLRSGTSKIATADPPSAYTISRERISYRPVQQWQFRILELMPDQPNAIVKGRLLRAAWLYKLDVTALSRLQMRIPVAFSTELCQVVERGQQEFQAADGVDVWLGESSEDSDIAMAYVARNTLTEGELQYGALDHTPTCIKHAQDLWLPLFHLYARSSKTAPWQSFANAFDVTLFLAHDLNLDRHDIPKSWLKARHAARHPQKPARNFLNVLASAHNYGVADERHAVHAVLASY
ncbi:hypothetical protein AC578_4405 [Pseudocercospora eumusae]|uniref:Uncharacterized protein n=1 Tax=Pseudocercospora eumusae TaxID=321146 RepID=A0A139H2G0_9PEZI|nr:hypothetical protein AC578_4405 [Pseudocercospora eumusae]